MRELVHFAAPPLPEKPGDFSGTPLSRTSPGTISNRTAIQFSRCIVRGRCLRTRWARRKSPLTMFGQRGAKKEVVLRNFFYFFALPCRKPGGFNEALHLLSHWKGRLWGCLENIFLHPFGTPSPSAAAIVHSLPREEQVKK